MEQIYIGMVDCARGALADCLAEACLDDAERQRFERIRLPLAKRCFAEGRRLARQMTAALTARDPASLGCVIDPRGKPRFADLPDWHFSITHSGTLVACACSALALGLDAEYHKPGKSRVEIAERFFTPAEASAIRAHLADSAETAAPGTQPIPRRFYQYWVLKEAWLKWHGIGMAGLSGVPEYLFESAGEEAGPGRLLRRDGLAPDACLAVWDVRGTEPAADSPCPRWSLGLAAGQAWRLVWDRRFAPEPWLVSAPGDTWRTAT